MGEKIASLLHRCRLLPALAISILVMGNVVVSMIVQVPVARASGEPPFVAKLEPQIKEKLAMTKTPGAIIFVDVPGQGSWETTMGIGNITTHQAMGLTDHMRIGSITKTFTGTVILQLVDQGKLGLDDPVAKYQPEVPNGQHITIRQLLNMTSGLYNYSDDKNLNQALDNNPSKAWTPQELVAIAFQHQPYFAPGQGFHYSNTNFILLGMIIEQITNKPVEQVFQQNIFTPLAMHDTSMPEQASSTATPSTSQTPSSSTSPTQIHLAQTLPTPTASTQTPSKQASPTLTSPTQTPSIQASPTSTSPTQTPSIQASPTSTSSKQAVSTFPDPHPQGYMFGTNVSTLDQKPLTGDAATKADNQAGTPRDVTNMNPAWAWTAGSAISTVHDLQIWVKALATGQLLKPATQKERLSWIPVVAGSNTKYGLGIANFAGFIGHNGSIPGFQSFAAYEPQKQETVIVLTNLSTAPDGTGPADAIAEIIAKGIS